MTTTKTLRNLGYRNIPILGLTANAFQQDREQCLEAGMNDYISKPVNPSKLIEMIRRWLCRDTIIPSSSTEVTCENEAVRLLRSRSIHTPIIALTANAMPEDRRKCIEAGFSDYLTKPFHYPQLVEIIEKYLKPISCGITLPE